MNERVCKLALVMPCRIGVDAFATSVRFSLGGGLRRSPGIELDAVHLLAHQEGGLAGIYVISTFCSIWRTITSICLSLILTPCKPVDVLHLVDEVIRQRLDAEDRAGCRAARGCHPSASSPFCHIVALVDHQVLALGHHVLLARPSPCRRPEPP